MPETTYKIDYQVPHGPAVKGLDTIESRLVKFEQTLDRIQHKLKTFGSDHAGVTKYLQALHGLEAGLKATTSDGDKAKKEIKEVGKDKS